MSAVYVGTTTGLFTWDGKREVSSRDPYANLGGGRSIGALAPASDGVLAIVDGVEVWRLGAAAERLATWQEPALTCIAPLGEGAVVGTVGAHVAMLHHGDLLIDESFDALPERAKWYTPWGAPADTRSIGTRGERCYVNVHVGGVASREPLGWRALVDIDVDVHQVTVVGDGLLVVATGAAAIGVSRDDGATWAWRDEGLHGTYARAVAVSGDTMIVTASTGPFTKEGAVYRATLHDDGAPFERCEDGIPHSFPHNLDTHTLAATDGLVALATEEGELYVSRDEATTWEPWASGLGRARSVAVL